MALSIGYGAGDTDAPNQQCNGDVYREMGQEVSLHSGASETATVCSRVSHEQEPRGCLVPSLSHLGTTLTQGHF